MDIQAFTDAATRAVVSFSPMFPKYVNTETGRQLTSGWLKFDCGHAYQWHPHGLADDRSEPAAGDRELCAVCVQEALNAHAGGAYCRCGHLQSGHNDGGHCWPRVGVTCMCAAFRETRSNMEARS